jgi:hypothetical protein
MKDLKKHLPMLAVVTLGVILAGYVMEKGRSSLKFLGEASEGFQGL